MSLIVVADRDDAEKLKDKFGAEPIVMGGAQIVENPDDIELDDYEGFSGAFNATFIAGTGVEIEEDEDDDGEPIESIFIEELEE